MHYGFLVLIVFVCGGVDQTWAKSQTLLQQGFQLNLCVNSSMAMCGGRYFYSCIVVLYFAEALF